MWQIKKIHKTLALVNSFWYYIQDSRLSRATKWEVADTPRRVVLMVTGNSHRASLYSNIGERRKLNGKPKNQN